MFPDSIRREKKSLFEETELALKYYKVWVGLKFISNELRWGLFFHQWEVKKIHFPPVKFYKVCYPLVDVVYYTPGVEGKLKDFGP